MKIDEILRNKGHDVITITESKSVLAAVEVLWSTTSADSSSRRVTGRREF